MDINFQLASVHGMLYTGGNVEFSPDGSQLYSPVQNYLSAVQLQKEGHLSHCCSNSHIQCFDLSSDGDLAFVVGQRGLGFFYLLSARVVVDTISFPVQCTVSCVRFSPCDKYIAIALENTLQIFTTPNQRTVSYHDCHRLENYHAALSLPILFIEWSPTSSYLLICGRDARMKILPREAPPRLKGTAAHVSLLVGHRSGVVGAWFKGDHRIERTLEEVSASAKKDTDSAGGEMDKITEEKKEEEERKRKAHAEEMATEHVVSVSCDNVVITWKRSAMTRKKVLQAIALSQMNARVASAVGKKNVKKLMINNGNNLMNDEEEADDEEEEEEENNHLSDDDDEEHIPLSFLEKQRALEVMEHGIQISNHNDDSLPPLLRYAYEIDQKFMLRPNGTVMVADYHAARGLLALGYSSGTFAIHSILTSVTEGWEGGANTQTKNNGGISSRDLTITAGSTGTGDRFGEAPSSPGHLPLLHLLSISAQSLTAVRFSPSGDHIAFGSAHLKQLLVWDWKSEAYVLKEQAHYYGISHTTMTPDCMFIISGGEDGKVKVWKTGSGQCIVTFTEHTGPISGLTCSATSNAVFSCSLDGTARAFDLSRYRHFRVFTSPEGSTGGMHTQFSCVAVDPSGDLLAVGSRLLNRIYLFSVQTGRAVDILQGHESPLACLAFHPSGTTLASGALDHNLVFWDLFTEKDGGERLKGEAEVLHVGTEVLSLVYSTSGRRMAILTAKQEVTVYETSVPSEPEVIKVFLTQFDAAGGWQKKIGPHSANTSTRFTKIAFSPEADKIIAGGDSKWIVMYHATQGYVLRKWAITSNLDVLGAEEQFSYRSMTEGGFLGDIDVDDDDVHLTQRKIMEMPGSRHPHFATGKRKTELVARSMDLCFAATGTDFVVATSVGLLVFSTRVARPRFQPLQLVHENITTLKVKEQLTSGHPVLALIGALILGDRLLGVECLRAIPRASIPIAVSSIPSSAFPLLVYWVSEEVDASPGWESALLFAQSLLLHSNEGIGTYSQDRSAALPAALKTLQRSLLSQRPLTEVARENYFSLQYLIDMGKVTKRKKKDDKGGAVLAKEK